MKILLTGALGFIGRNFILQRPNDWQVFALDKIADINFQKKCVNTSFHKVDLISTKDVQQLANKLHTRFDACLFLAANGDPALSVPDPLWDLQMTTETLINTAASFDITKLVYLSSGAVYEGNFGAVTPKTPIDPILPYAISHLATEQYARFFQKTGKVKEYVVIRFFGAYGPYEPPRKIYTKLVKSLGLNRQTEFIIKGDGNNLIDAMYVEDAIRGMVAVINSNRKNLTVDFCKGDHPTVNQLVAQAGRVFNKGTAISHQGKVPEYNRFYASRDNFNKLFSFKPQIPLESGLHKLANYLQNKLTIKPKIVIARSSGDEAISSK